MEAVEPECLAADIDGVESVYILVGAYGLDDSLLVDVRGEGKLDDEAVHVGVVVESGDEVEQLLLGDVGLAADDSGAESAGLAGLYLVGHICLAAPVVAYEDGYQVGCAAAVGDKLCYTGCYIGFDGGSRRLSVNQLHGRWGILGGYLIQVLAQRLMPPRSPRIAAMGFFIDPAIFIIWRIWSNCLIMRLTSCIEVPEPAAMRLTRVPRITSGCSRS